MAENRFVTPDGEPPFGGMPPHLAALTGHQHGMPFFAQQQAHFFPVFPQPDIGAVPGWQPWQELPVHALPQYVAPAPAPAPGPGLMPGPAPAQFVPAPAPAPKPEQKPAPAPAAGQWVPAPAPVPAPAISPVRAPLPHGCYIPTTEKPLVFPTGQGYIFPQTHTNINIIEANFAPWEHPGRHFQMRAYSAPVHISVKELIEQLVATKSASGAKVTSRGITEVLEVGTGSWLKGTEFWIGDNGNSDEMKKRVKQSLARVGWDAARGVQSRPVWLALLMVTEQ